MSGQDCTDIEPISEAKSDETRQDSMAHVESDSLQKLDLEKEDETGWSNEWAEYAEVEEEEGDGDIEDIRDESTTEIEVHTDCPSPVEQTTGGDAFASDNTMDPRENVDASEEIPEYTAEQLETTSEDAVDSESDLSAIMTNGDSCTQHDTGLDMMEASGAEKTTVDSEKQAPRIVRKIKIKAKMNEVREQVDPCVDPVVASEPTTLSVDPCVDPVVASEP